MLVEENEEIGRELPASAITIGSVCRQLRAEFPDVSISKIRYLEDQKLLTPQRTASGYRLYSGADIDRLRVILREQRDRFLPLRVIRQGLDSGQIKIEKRPVRAGGAGDLYSEPELVKLAGTDVKFLKELIEYGLLTPKVHGGKNYYGQLERSIVDRALTLAAFGVAARNLKILRNAADKQAALIDQVVAPSLHSENVKRRAEALRELDELLATTTELQHLVASQLVQR